MSRSLLDEVQLGSATARSRVVFGPHVTNLGEGRAISERHAAYYGRRARGGCGVVVTEIASVHESDWPYERAPLATRCPPGWSAVAEACRRHGTIVLAGLGHAGMQGSTSWSQDVLWAPSLVPHVTTREQPLAMGPRELRALREGFAAAARDAVASGLDGVEINAGQHSLLRQFCSGLTNLRDDAYGTERGRLLAEVLADVRAALGTRVLGLRLCTDELAPWAGLTPPAAAALAASVGDVADYVAVERGSIYSEAMTRPDGHVEPGFNAEAARVVGAELEGRRAVVCLQGSLVDVVEAQRHLDDGTCALVEMTRAQIADPDLVAKLRRGDAGRVRPCILCNQHCCVRDVRNPIVSCSVNPVAGHELDDAALDVDDEPAAGPGTRGSATVVGGGVAGMECARLLARRGRAVTLFERSDSLGGALRDGARLPGRGRLGVLCDWLASELYAEGVTIRLGEAPEAPQADLVVAATGAGPPRLELRDGDDGTVRTCAVAEVVAGAVLAGRVVVLDPVGGPEGIGAAELAAGSASVTLVTPDLVAGAHLALSGDLVAANERLANAGVAVLTHAGPTAIGGGAVVVEDRFTAEVTRLDAYVCVDAGHRTAAAAPSFSNDWLIGDAVAPRGILMAMLEARRAALGATR